MSIDPTIELGTVIGLFGVMGSVLYFGFQISGEIRTLQMKVDLLWRWFAVEHGMNGAKPAPPAAAVEPEAKWYARR